jgi:hypothetical protein
MVRQEDRHPLSNLEYVTQLLREAEQEGQALVAQQVILVVEEDL